MDECKPLVSGDTHASYQLSPDDEILVVGRTGMLLCSKDTERLEPMLVAYLSLMTRNMFMRSLFQRTAILADTLKSIRVRPHHVAAYPPTSSYAIQLKKREF